MRLGVLILPDQRWQSNVERWRLADELGFDSAWTYDHIWWRTLRDEPWFAAGPILAAAAAMTKRLRIGLMVASPNFRHPVTTAKDALAIDDISGGRFTLGVGAGAPLAGDAEVLGGRRLTRGERSRRFEEFVDLTARLIDNPVTTYAGQFYAANQARMIPCSLPQGPLRPRLAVAASGPRGLQLAARHGDAWITPGPADWTAGHSPNECHAAVARQTAKLERACVSAGRSYARMERIFIATTMSGNPLASVESCIRMAERYAALGLTELIVHWPREAGIYAGSLDVLRDIAAKALPEITRM